jgi:monovalent cation/hydrogen antiporter
MHQELFVVLALLVGVVLVHAASVRLRLSFPILLVLVGLVVSLIPGLPTVKLGSDLVFLIFLPPLLYEAAWFTSWRDFKRFSGAISLQAVGLVLFTAAAIATVAHALIPGCSWALGFLLGGIVAPPDAVAATSVLQGLRIPRTSVSILEGESLVNDATSLIVVRFALASLVAGPFLLEEAVTRFIWVVIAGVALGLSLGYVLYFFHRRLGGSPASDTTLTLLTPYLIYVSAEQIHASGVLAVVSAGLFLSSRSHRFLDAPARVYAQGAWATAIFVLNGLAFILIGLQLPDITEDLGGLPWSKALGVALLVSLTAIAVRIVWTFPAAFLPSFLPWKPKPRRFPSWKLVLLIAWSGMRGVVSLAAALSIPHLLPNGEPFPLRPLFIFVTFVVILVTLVAQGLTLPWLVGFLHFELTEDQHKHRAALDEHLTTHVKARRAEPLVGAPEGTSIAQEALERELLNLQRSEIVRLRDLGQVPHEVARDAEFELDLLLARLEARLKRRTD